MVRENGRKRKKDVMVIPVVAWIPQHILFICSLILGRAERKEKINVSRRKV